MISRQKIQVTWAEDAQGIEEWKQIEHAINPEVSKFKGDLQKGGNNSGGLHALFCLYHVARSRDFFLLPASVQNSEETEELLEAEGLRSIRQKQKIQIPSTFRRRKSNRICNLPLLEHIFWLKSHPANMKLVCFSQK